MYIEKTVEKPVYIEKIVEKPVYVDKIVEKPIYIEKGVSIETPSQKEKRWYIQLKNFLSTNASIMINFLMDKISEDGAKYGDPKEIEIIKHKLGSYKQKKVLADTELNQIEEIIEKLESKLGSSSVSESAFVNWNLEKIKPEKFSFKIEVWTEKLKARDIKKAPKSGSDQTYSIGDKIKIYFRSEKDCYLFLINYGTSGKLTVLFPNFIFKDNYIKAEKLYEIGGNDYPFDYELSGPPGTEKIKAMATTQKFHLINIRYKKGEIFSTSRSASRDISAVAKKLESKELREWAEAMCEIKVE